MLPARPFSSPQRACWEAFASPSRSALPELGEGLHVTGEEAEDRAITYLLKEPEQEAGWAGTGSGRRAPEKASLMVPRLLLTTAQFRCLAPGSC